MANEIKDLLGSSTALTITLASLGSSSTGVGRQGTLVDNASTRAGKAIVYYKITQGTSPTGNKAAYFYLIRSDNHGTQHQDGGAGASDAAWTVPPNMQPVHVAANKGSPSTGDVLQGSFVIDRPGPEWTIGLYHDTGVNLDADAGDHWIRYVTVNPEVQ